MGEGPRLDVAGAVRDGEALDVLKVDAWLKTRLPTLTGTPKVTQYSGGASNWTYRLEYPHDDLVLRRPPSGTKAKSAHDMKREYTVQAALKPVFPYVPEMIAHCDDLSVLGVEFYVMRRIAGVIPRASLGVKLDPPTTRALCENVIDTLVALHQVDPKSCGLESLGKGAGYCKRQVDGWSDRYDKARTWNVPRFTKVIAWLKAHTPLDVKTCVIHNDFRFDNVVLDPDEPTKVIGVLDWEMATLGDPLMDLGSSLAYWVQADDDLIAMRTRRQPTHLPGMLTRKEVVARYFEKSGLPPRDFTFYEVFGLFRLAVIAQQISYRYHHKQTRNPAFKHFWALAHYFEWRCHRLIAKAA